MGDRQPQKAVDMVAESFWGSERDLAIRGETKQRREEADPCPVGCGQSWPDFPLGSAQDRVSREQFDWH